MTGRTPPENATASILSPLISREKRGNQSKQSDSLTEWYLKSRVEAALNNPKKEGAMPKNFAFGKIKGGSISCEGVKLSRGTRLFVEVEPRDQDCSLVFLELANSESGERLKLQCDRCIAHEQFPKGYIAAHDYLNFLGFWPTPPPPEEHIDFVWRALSSIAARESRLTISTSPVAHTADDVVIVFSLDIGAFSTELQIEPEKVSGFLKVLEKSFEDEAEESARYEHIVRITDRD